MKRRLWYAAASVLLALCVTFVVWQGSFRTEGFDPQSVSQVFLYWAVSSLVFVLTITLGFILFRTAVKLYVERQSRREGSRIQTKLVVGALALSFLPVLFLVLFSVQVLNFNLLRWFSRPAEDIRIDLVEVTDSFKASLRRQAEAQARWLASLPEVQAAAREGMASPRLDPICREAGIESAWIIRVDDARVRVCGSADPAGAVRASAMLADANGLSASQLQVALAGPTDLNRKQAEIEQSIADFEKLSRARKDVRNFYLMLLALIGLFILFVATWIALFLSKQISVPISALLGAAREVRNGNLAYRVKVRAVDELATLVRAFNEMTQDLESNERELERRRRFTEAIVENIPTGVISLASDGRLLKINRSLQKIFPHARQGESSIEDLFTGDDLAEIRYLMKRSRRTGIASRQFELRRDRQTVQLSVLISALEDNLASGYVMVIEDTTEMLRAQKAAAWQEVARRIAHEIKNPLTPISLCSERLARQLDRVTAPPETVRVMRECSVTISQEVESVRTLVDEFSQFSRFPVANPAPTEINTVVESALAVFEGRLDGIRLVKSLAPGLPPVNIDPEQFKRVVVNLVDNAAEAMIDSPLKRLYVATQAAPDSVEIVVSDTGRGVQPEDRERLFLPYFSTKGRGTGLGLAIVSQIVAEHKAQVRVEDNRPSGARFVVEIPAIANASEPPVEIRTKEAVG
jgi:two-component system nitrogen regulation sensor histidine kinase NtrY